MVKFIDNCNSDDNEKVNEYDTKTVVRNISSSLLSSYKTDHIDDPIESCFSLIPTVLHYIIIIIVIIIIIIIIIKATMDAYNNACYFFSNDNDYCPFKPDEPNLLLASMLISYRRYHYHYHYHNYYYDYH